MKKIIIFAALLVAGMLVGAASAQKQTNIGPVTSPHVNATYYVGVSPYLTVQSAVTVACNQSGTKQLVYINANANPSDTPVAATGCAAVGIIDGRVVPSVVYTWNGSAYGVQTTPSGNTLKGTSLWVYGDSLKRGDGSTNVNSTSDAARTASDTPTGQTHLLGYGGNTMAQIVNKLFATYAPDVNTSGTVIGNGGANDGIRCPAEGTNSTDCANNYTVQQSAFSAWAMIPYQYRQMASTAATVTGWVADSTLPFYQFPLSVPPGGGTPTNPFYNFGTPLHASTSGQVLTFNIPTSSSTFVGLTTIQSNSATGTYTVRVDGNLVTDLISGTTTFSAHPSGTSSIAYGSGQTPVTSVFARQDWPVTPGAAHTVIVTPTASAQVIVVSVDWAPAASTANENALFFETPVPSFGNQFNSIIQATATHFKTAGLLDFFVDMVNGTPGVNGTTDISTTATPLCPATASPSHPNDCGQFKMEQTRYNVELANGYVFQNPPPTNAKPLAGIITYGSDKSVTLNGFTIQLCAQSTLAPYLPYSAPCNVFNNDGSLSLFGQTVFRGSPTSGMGYQEYEMDNVDGSTNFSFTSILSSGILNSYTVAGDSAHTTGGSLHQRIGNNFVSLVNATRVMQQQGWIVSGTGAPMDMWYCRTSNAFGSTSVPSNCGMHFLIPGGAAQGTSTDQAEDDVEFAANCKYILPGNQNTDYFRVCVASGDPGGRVGVSTTLPLAAPSLTATGSAAVASSGQISFGGATAAASNCNAGGVLTGVAGCLVVNVAGTTHYTPYF